MTYKFNKSNITLFESFSGIGTQSMALKRLASEYGFTLESLGVSEIDKYAIRSYEAIHGATPNFGSITDIQEIPQVDIFTYSFPCTDISNSGQRKGFERGSGTRSGLLWEVERILINQKAINKLPKVLLLENVKALINKNFIGGFNEWLNFLELLGYSNHTKVLNAKDFGVPQNRERVFVVSILGNEEYEFPKGFELTKTIADYIHENHDAMCNISDRRMDKLVHLPRPNEIQVTSHFDSREHREGGWRRFVCPTLSARDYKDPKIIFNPNAIIPIRKFNPREYWRLMGISDSDFDKARAVVSRSQLYKQAGNAIVVDVLYYIFKEMFEGE